MSALINKVIFLTGGASGIGECCAMAYKNAGAKLFVMDKSEDALKELAAKLGDSHTTFLGNVQDGEDIKNAIDQALNIFGKIDVIQIDILKP